MSYEALSPYLQAGAPPPSFPKPRQAAKVLHFFKVFVTKIFRKFFLQSLCSRRTRQKKVHLRGFLAESVSMTVGETSTEGYHAKEGH